MSAIKQAKEPTLREEITFKVAETYEKLLDIHQRKGITSAQLDCAVRALIAATGWCIEKEALGVLSSDEEMFDESFLDKRYFVKKEKYVVLKRFPDQNLVQVFINGTKRQEMCYGNEDDCVRGLEMSRDYLLKIGYVEIT
jgi:hypothetical protein